MALLGNGYTRRFYCVKCHYSKTFKIQSPTLYAIFVHAGDVATQMRKKIVILKKYLV